MMMMMMMKMMIVMMRNEEDGVAMVLCYKFPNMYSRVVCKFVLNDILMSFFYIVKRLEQRCISAI